MNTLKNVAKALVVSASVMMFASCSMKNIESETGVIVDSIDKQNLWTVVEAEDSMYSPFMDVANKNGTLDPSKDKNYVWLNLAYNYLTVNAQDLKLQSGNKILEVNQPIFSDYGEINVGDQGVVVYVRWNSEQNNVFMSNKKLHPRFVPASYIKSQM